MSDPRQRAERPAWPYPFLIGAILIAGFALRCLAARGGLWLDEAWSAQFARESGSAIGVLVQINHDNNHHLNTLWLQLVGEAAPPLLQRGLAIVTGTASIAVAAWIVGRRSRAAGLAAALLFAVSPMLVNFGSEARGYAPMLLASLVAVLLVDRWLAGPERPPPGRALALTALLGILSQPSFLFTLAALAGWSGIVLLRREGARRAALGTIRALGPAIGVAAAFMALVLLIARASPAGFRFGHLDDFSLDGYGRALSTIAGSSLGLPWWLAMPLLAALLAALGAGLGASRRTPFYAMTILAFPLAVALLQLPNTGFARYFLLCTLGLLLLAAELIGGGMARGGWRRWLAGGVLVAFVAGGLVEDRRLIADGRGHPDGAIELLVERSPGGAELLIEHPRSLAVLEVAARRRGYGLTIARTPCPAARFVHLDRDHDDAFPDSLVRCDRRYRPIGGSMAAGLSGISWRLYEAVR